MLVLCPIYFSDVELVVELAAELVVELDQQPVHANYYSPPQKQSGEILQIIAILVEAVLAPSEGD